MYDVENCMYDGYFLMYNGYDGYIGVYMDVRWVYVGTCECMMGIC